MFQWLLQTTSGGYRHAERSHRQQQTRADPSLQNSVSVRRIKYLKFDGVVAVSLKHRSRVVFFIVMRMIVVQIWQRSKQRAQRQLGWQLGWGLLLSSTFAFLRLHKAFTCGHINSHLQGLCHSHDRDAHVRVGVSQVGGRAKTATLAFMILCVRDLH